MQIDVIDPKKTAMIVVDMQNDFVAEGTNVILSRSIKRKSETNSEAVLRTICL